jgi:acetolactate synthase-1/2/3 large subunit
MQNLSNIETWRSGGQILVDQLHIHGVQHVFCVPGESYLAALDAMYDARLEVTICRQEGGAAMMAEAYGKITGQPGICFVTRGPGATNASSGVHVAAQDSTPLILFVGQVARGMRGREAFQELDYRAVFGTIAKWVTEIDDPARIPELISRAFYTALNGRPGPVVVALPEDVLSELALCQDGGPAAVIESSPAVHDVERFEQMLAAAKKPVLIAGGSRWNRSATAQLERFAQRYDVPVCVAFRRQALFPGTHPNYVGDLGVGANPVLVLAIRESDMIILLGTRLSEIASQSYTLLDIPHPKQLLVHVHPGMEELGRVYQADLALNLSPGAFLAEVNKTKDPAPAGRNEYIHRLREAYLRWSGTLTEVPGAFNLGTAVAALCKKFPAAVTISTGAGNYAIWVNRFFRFGDAGRMLAPTSGSMGYGVPAAIGALRLDPKIPTIAFAGDGCFLMTGQEFATAVQYNLPLIVVVADNGMYGTIRMHQERHYPGRVVATSLKNPDFVAYATAFGGYGERVERTEDFMPAFERAVASGKPAILHCIVDREALTPSQSLTEIRDAALRQQMD